jgi:hypothetical protein
MFTHGMVGTTRRVFSSVLWTAFCSCFVLGLSAGTASAEKRHVEICHNGRLISVDVHAVPAHLEHGDILGTCDSGAPPCNCSLQFNPVVCGDGNIYANQCFADCAGAPGPCTSFGICSNIFDPVTCDGVTYANECQARLAGCTGPITTLCVCPQIYAPVRCSDGTIYVNQCVATCRGATGCTPLQ